MRTLAAAVVLLAAAPAGALSTNPSPPGWAKASPSGQFVLVRVTEHGWRRDGDPDMPAIERDCTRSGLYRRGEWGAPLWSFDAFGPWSVYMPADDGVHLVEYSHVTPGLTFALAHNDPQYREAALRAEAFKFYAGGKLVRAASVGEVIKDPDAVVAGAKWYERAEFRPDGLLHVEAADGNRTAFDPATGERVSGEGVSTPFRFRPWHAAAGLALAGGLLVLRATRVRRRGR